MLNQIAASDQTLGLPRVGKRVGESIQVTNQNGSAVEPPQS
jgi:hypothetical protein